MTVLMAVHDGAAVVCRAVESVLAQDFEDFELLVVDDGSTDDTISRLGRTADPRLRVVSVPHRGLPAALNHGLGLARGRYVARHDDDDVSLPARLRRQVEFLDARPDHVLVGSDFEFTATDGRRLRVGRPPESDLRISWTLLFHNVFSHGCAMFRRDAAREIGGYAPLPRSQDYDLWCRLARVGPVGNVPEVLYRWTQDPEGLSGGAGRPLQDRIARAVSVRRLADALGEPLRGAAGGALHVLGNGREWEVPASLAPACVRRLYRLKRRFLGWRDFPAGDREWLDAEVRRRVAKLLLRAGPSGAIAAPAALGLDPALLAQLGVQAARRLLGREPARPRSSSR